MLQEVYDVVEAPRRELSQVQEAIDDVKAALERAEQAAA